MTMRTQDPRARHDRYRAEIELQVRRLRDIVTSGADLSATVPTCRPRTSCAGVTATGRRRSRCAGPSPR
ncbi:hypothetical protein [Streptomyces europaeiscabiei]|uniref:hypothetical protein n=1 Tax=Streptomyces europaeiscabiei TaxID=146819 RepID=UPI002E2839FC|nr:hypothetical protein [Streptomyces europaeiscabiei]